jgi:hypothetical protein
LGSTNGASTRVLETVHIVRNYECNWHSSRFRNATLNRTFGHYARVLVDIDVSKHLFEEIFVEREGYAFNLGIVSIYKDLL